MKLKVYPSDLRSLPWSVFLVMLFCSATLASKKGFLLTSPKVLIAGSTEKLCLSLYGITSGGQVNITLENSDKPELIIARTVHNVTAGNDTSCLKMVIPSKSYKNIKMNIDGHFEEENYEVHGSTKVSIESKMAPMTFIQADKPIYKPGQIVKFRILKLDLNLLPSKEPVENVWIEDPTGIRVAMWRNPESDQGLVELSFKLSDEPPLGDWSITAQLASGKEIKKFTVKEYVLPKFSVDITFPTCIPPSCYASEEVILWKVCAKYSYGQPVVGDLRVITTVSQRDRNFNPAGKYNDATFVKKINGCSTDIIITRDNLPEMKAVKDWSVSVHLFAEVTENGTGIKINSSKTIEVRANPYKVTMQHKMYFKPGLNFYGTALVSFVDGQPAPNRTLTIAIETYKKDSQAEYSGSNDYQSDENGEIHFTIAPQSAEIEKMRLKVKPSERGSMFASASRVTHHSIVNSWHSPSKSFLQLEVNTESTGTGNDRPLPCNAKHPIGITSIFPKDVQGKDITLHYQVYSRGELLFRDQFQHFVNSTEEDDEETYEAHALINDTDEPNGTTDGSSSVKQYLLESHLRMDKLQIELDIKPHMSPELYLLVFYVRPDGEVVSDYTNIKIENCFANRVEMSFGDDEILPGTPTKIKLEAHPESLCALSAVDQSVHLLSGNNQLDAQTVFSKLASVSHIKKFKPYESDADEISCVGGSPGVRDNPYRHVMFESGSSFMDSMVSFRKAGIAVITDLTMITRPCKALRPMWYRGLSFMPARGIPYYSDSIGYRGLAGQSFMRSGVTSVLDSQSTNLQKMDVVPQPKNEVEQQPIDVTIAKPAVEIRDFFPETWLWELHRVGKNGTAKFEREIPHSVTTWTASTFCTSSDKGFGISSPTSIRSFQPFFLSFSMPYSVKNGELVPLKVSIFNYLSKCFTVNILIEKSVAFEVSGSPEARACVCGHQSHTHTFSLRPKKMGHLNVTVHAHSIGGRNMTSRCKIGTKEANVIAHDAITKPLLVKAQGFPKEIVNMTMFCPSEKSEAFSNIYTLVLPDNVIEGSARAYVRIIGDLMGPSITGLDKLVKLPTGCGEQNMVLFVPNIFVLQYLTNTNQLTEDVELKAKAHLETGYQRQLTYRHKDGSYSAFGDSDKEGSMWLTAFVLKSFAKARPFTFVDGDELNKTMTYIKKHQMENGCFESKGRLLSKAMQGGLESDKSSAIHALTAYVVAALLEAGMPPSRHVIKNAFLCLETETQPSLYLLALKTYASAMLGTDEHNTWKNWNDLEAKSIEKDGLMHWEMKGNSHAVNIEITSYALMALTAMNSSQHNVKALSIVRWLAQQRNSNGGFVSTQDTVLALQALSTYASIMADKSANVSIEVKIETDDLDDTIHVNEENKLVMQTRKLSHFPTVLDVEATGSGCALLEVTLKYNVEEEKPQDAFALDVDVDCDKEKIHICTKYLNADEKSNMAVVEVNMLSGYEAFKSKLDELKNDVRTPIKRADVNDEGTVNVYFDELTLEELCFDVDVQKTIDVKNVKPAFVTVYDYYQPEFSTSKYYSFDSLSSCTGNRSKISATGNRTDDNRGGWPQRYRGARNSRRAYHDEPDSFSSKDVMNNPIISPAIKSETIVPKMPPDCPTCLKTMPSNFAQILCYGEIAVIADVRNTTMKRMKLRTNVHGSLDRFQRINVVTHYDIGQSCQCDLLSAGKQLVLIVGKLSSGTAGIPDPIKLNRDSYIIRLDQNELKSLRRLHQQC